MKFIFILLFIFFLFPVFSKDYTLDEIYKIIDNNNYSVKQLESITGSLKYQVDAEGSDFMDTSIGYGLNDLTIKDNGVDTDMLKHRFYIKQQIPLSGRLYFKKKVAQYEYINSIEETKMKKIELKKMVLSNITDYHIFKEIEKNRMKELELLNKLKEIVKIQFSTGKALISNITQVDIRIAQSENMLLEVRNMEEILKNEIIDILDVSDDTFEITSLKFSHELIDVSTIDTEKLYNKAFEYNPTLKIKDNEIKRIENQKTFSLTELIPNLEVMFEYMLKPNPTIENSFNFQIELNVPLLSSYSKINKVEMYKKQVEKFSFEKKDAQNSLKNYLKRVILDLNNNVNQSTLLYNKIFVPSEENINSLIQSYQVNKLSIDSLIDSILMVYDLQNQYYNYLGKIYKILFEIESLTGEKLYNL